MHVLDEAEAVEQEPTIQPEQILMQSVKESPTKRFERLRASLPEGVQIEFELDLPQDELEVQEIIAAAERESLSMLEAKKA